MKTILVYSTNSTQPQEIRVEETATWADVKREAGVSGENWTGVGRPSKTTYAADSSSLHPDDNKINIYPKKMKAGLKEVTVTSSEGEELLEILSDLDELRNKVLSTYADIYGVSDSKIAAEAGISISSQIEDDGDCPEDSLGLN